MLDRVVEVGRVHVRHSDELVGLLAVCILVFGLPIVRLLAVVPYVSSQDSEA
jgi:hypothetical protein